MKIILENVHKTFESVVAVNKLNLQIDDGQLISILGPSGCGKSTTLFLIAGLLKPDSGNIYFGDKAITNIEPQDKRDRNGISKLCTIPTYVSTKKYYVSFKNEKDW